MGGDAEGGEPQPAVVEEEPQPAAVEGEPPAVIDVGVRRLQLDSEDDRSLCAQFACGDEEWEIQVSDFIARKLWLPGRAAEHVVLAIDRGTGRIFGFGAWKHTTVELPQRDEPVEVIRICYFGVAEEFKGAVDSEGRRWASRLYTVVESEALADSGSPNMPIELFCDGRNERGLRFWTGASRGFEVIGQGYGELLRLVRVPPG